MARRYQASNHLIGFNLFFSHGCVRKHKCASQNIPERSSDVNALEGLGAIRDERRVKDNGKIP